MTTPVPPIASAIPSVTDYLSTQFVLPSNPNQYKHLNIWETKLFNSQYMNPWTGAMVYPTSLMWSKSFYILTAENMTTSLSLTHGVSWISIFNGYRNRLAFEISQNITETLLERYMLTDFFSLLLLLALAYTVLLVV